MATEAISKQNFLHSDLEEIIAQDSDLKTHDPKAYFPIGLLFQTGYLTLKKRAPRLSEPSFIVGYPNEEVRKVMAKAMLRRDVGETATFDIATQIADSVLSKDWNRLIDVLNMRLAKDANTHSLQGEKAYNSKLLTAFACSLEKVHSEYSINGVRIDTLIEQEIQGKPHTIIIEYKISEDASGKQDRSTEAINQIRHKSYTAAFDTHIILLGITINTSLKKITHFAVAEIER